MALLVSFLYVYMMTPKNNTQHYNLNLICNTWYNLRVETIREIVFNLNLLYTSHIRDLITSAMPNELIVRC